MHQKLILDKNIIYRQNVDLKKYHTFRLSSVARHFFIPKNIDGLIAVKKYFEKENIDYMILGAGSNVIFSEKYINTNIVYTGFLNKVSFDENIVLAETGVLLPKLIALAYDRGLSKMEFLSALPASVGGAIYMNARCYGSEMSHVLKNIWIIDEKNEYRKISKDECEFAYKKSVFQKKRYIIISAEFELAEGNKKEIKSLMKKYKNDRINKKQFSYPSAGCAFLNDYSLNMIAAIVIDKAKMRGKRIGGAMVLKNHANFIVNKKHADGKDVINLIKHVKETVKKQSGVELYEEVRIVGKNDHR